MSAGSPATPIAVEVFFDGDCPLCEREIRMLRRLDRKGGHIRFTDIAAPDFDSSVYGKSWEQMMATIHARDAEGNWLEGVDVFRALYRAVGFTRLVAASRLPGLRGLLDLGYAGFSRYRLTLTGRSGACASDSCRPHDR